VKVKRFEESDFGATLRMDQAHRTEAACLLEQGASFPRRIGLKPIMASGDPIFAGFKHGAFSLYFGDSPIYHFDLEGRWQRAFVDGTHYLKGLDGTIYTIDRLREGPNLVLNRGTLSRAAGAEFDERVRATALQLITGLAESRIERVEPASTNARSIPARDLHGFLERIGSWDARAWSEHRDRYAAIFRPLAFLPPECQNAVVVQATTGQSTGREFGGSPVAELIARSPGEFAQHVRDVSALWGRRLLQSRVIFLAGSDVLHRPVDYVREYLAAIGRAFRIKPRAKASALSQDEEGEREPRFDGVHAFVDRSDGPLPDRAGWGDLAARGLVRVSFGVESGDPVVRSLYRKGWVNDDFRAILSNVKAAGLGVSVLTLVGAGGAERAGLHVEQTARLIDSLELEKGDFVFLLDENEICDRNAVPEGLALPQGAPWIEQQAKLKEALAPLKKRGIKVLPYTVEKQWT
jgi:hypothetical protein